MASKPRVTLKDFYRLSERRMRISIDLDMKRSKEHSWLETSRLRPLQVYFTMKHLFPDCTVTMLKTRHGFHIKAVGETIEKIPVAKRVTIRERLGDDPLRIECDQRKLLQNRPYLCDTLFSMKRGWDRVLHIVEEVNPIALPFASRLPSRKR